MASGVAGAVGVAAAEVGFYFGEVWLVWLLGLGAGAGAGWVMVAVRSTTTFASDSAVVFDATLAAVWVGVDDWDCLGCSSFRKE